MSADLTLLALPDTEAWRDTWAEFSANELIADDVDDHEARLYAEQGIAWTSRARHEEMLLALFSQPHIEVGQASTLGAALSGDVERYLPGPVARVMELLGNEGRVLTPGFAKELTVAFNLPNRSMYGRVRYQRLTDADEIAWRRAEAVKDRRTASRMYGRFIEPNIVQVRKGGALVRPRQLKGWLNDNLGMRIVSTLV